MTDIKDIEKTSNKKTTEANRLKNKIGIIRKIDELGRIVLPIEMRRYLSIDQNDLIEISCDNDSINIKKYVEGDIFNGSKDNLIDFYGKKISKESIIKMAELAGLKIMQ